MNISSESKQRKMKHDHYNTSPKVYQASPSLVSLVIVITGRRRIPFYGPARRQRARIGQTSDLILKTHT